MDPFLALLLKLGGLAMVCTTGFAAYWMKLRHERRTHGTDVALRQLQDQVEELRAATQGQVAELHDRLDFADRLLAQRRMDLPAPTDAPTPV